ncbi:GldG family protein [Tautonia sociabilis]|uniref:ABC transporter n=1 Tax=Tautonia sociabilis TaxID=2080755 RepID=A0A432MHQ2_9BACT|nr:GldG family protein [Tautonia sociabilis]RUL86471.1 ABC transporter [Tautonia sociabilis]
MGGRVLELLSGEAAAVVGLLIAGALALYWFLRGAPAGRAAESEPGSEAPPPGYRDRMAIATTAGMLGIGLGAYVALRFGVPHSIAVFAAAFAVLILTIRSNRRYRHASPSLRRMARFADASMTGALLAGILIVGNVLAFSYGARPIDLSLDRSYSLERTTIQQLQTLEEPVAFTVFFGSGERELGQVDRVRQLLRLYQAEAPDRISIDYLNPYDDPDRARELAEQVPGLALTEGGGVIVSYGEGDNVSRIIVRNADMFAAEMGDDPASSVVAETSFLGEAALTTALIRLKQGEQPIVAVTTGHGEPSIDAMDPRRPGLGQLRARLESMGMKVVAFNPAGQVPEGASVVIVAAPEETIGPEAAARLQGFSDTGGRLLVIQGNRSPSGLEEWLAGLGVGIGAGRVVDPTLALGGRPDLPMVEIPPGGNNPPIVAPLERRQVLMPFPAPIDAKLGAVSSGAFLVMPLLRTSRSSFVESTPEAGPPQRDSEADRPGPIVVAAAVADRPDPGDQDAEPTPRLVLIASPDAADNQTVAQVGFANLDLLVNAVGWLQDRPDLVGIAPRTYTARMLKAGPNLRAKLVLLPTMMAVSILVGLGLATYLARRE